MTELYPDGKRLWLSVCGVRGVDHQRAEIEWAQWEEGFLTQGEWQRVAERFTAGTAVSACGCETCRPITLSDMRMVLCSICGNKRCPHATDHRNVCGNSNEPGQPGSSYGGMRTLAAVNVGHTSVAVPTLTAASAPPVKQWQDIGRAVDLSLEELASVFDTLINRLGLQIVREQTPDYTNYELQPIGGDRAAGGQT